LSSLKSISKNKARDTSILIHISVEKIFLLLSLPFCFSLPFFFIYIIFRQRRHHGFHSGSSNLSGLAHRSYSSVSLLRSTVTRSCDRVSDLDTRRRSNTTARCHNLRLSRTLSSISRLDIASIEWCRHARQRPLLDDTCNSSLASGTICFGVCSLCPNFPTTVCLLLDKVH
jgi:hypothetical protein